MGVSGLLLDWDGTLLDSFRAQVTATKAALETHGGIWSSERFMAHPTDWRAHYREAGISEARLGDASAEYQRVYAEQTTRLRPHAKRALRRIANAGVALAIVTSGTRKRVMPEVRRAGLEELFLNIITFDDVAQPKPSPEGLVQAIGKLGTAPAHTIAIGDTAADAQAAEAAGVRHLVIRSPYTDERFRHEAAGSWWALERQLLTELQSGAA
jgi:pyrophosphatase PpaX